MWAIVCSDVNRHEREILLGRVEREGATVGAQIPDRLAVGGEVIPLRDRVLAFHRVNDPDEEGVKALTVALRGARKERLERIESDPALDRSAAEEIVNEVIGIDRALETLRSVGNEVDIEAEMERQKVADSERWQHFLKKARRDGVDRGLSR